MQKTLLFFSLMGLLGTAQAQWNPDPTENNLLVGVADKGTTVISEFSTVSDGSNGAFIAWVDTRNSAVSGADIFLIRILADGSIAPGFAPGGNLICNASGTQDQINMIADGAGGVVLAWRDARNSGSPVNNDIFAQRVNAGGNTLWSDNGVAIVASSVNEQSPIMALTSAATVGIVWRGTVTGLDLFGNFLNLSNGSKVLGSDITIITKPNNQTNQVVMPDGAGGFITAWTDARIETNNASIHAQRVNNSGTLLWGPTGNEADGLEISYIPGINNHLTPAITSDGTIGGAVIVFGSTRVASTDANLYAQKVSSDGVVQWTTNGVPVVLASGNQTDPLIRLSNDNVIIAWRDLRAAANNADIYAQSLKLTDGSPNWMADGVLITGATGNQPNSAANGFNLISDGAGGATIVWDDARNTTSNIDIYAQKINSAGAVQWEANGTPIANRAGSNQMWPSVVPAANNNLMVIWRDARNQSNAELFASILETSGVLPTHFLSVQAAQKGKQVEVIWATSGEQNLRHYVIERSTNGTTFAQAGTAAARNTQGRHTYSWLDDQAANGNYFYRIKSVNLGGSSQLSMVVQVTVAGTNNALWSIYPNPAVGNVHLMLGEHIEKGEYSIRIIDASGRIIQQNRVQKWQDTQQLTLGTAPLQGGLYRIQLINASGKTVATEAIFKQ